jgi:hypothetical protein
MKNRASAWNLVASMPNLAAQISIERHPTIHGKGD